MHNHLLTILAVALSFPQMANAGDWVRVTLPTDKASCTDNVVTVGHIANVKCSDNKLAEKLALLDLDQFTQPESTLTVTREQIRIRLTLAGMATEDITILGTKQVSVQQTKALDVSSVIETTLRDRLSDRYQIAPTDLVVTVDTKSSVFNRPNVLPASLNITQTMPAELPLGRKSIAVRLTDANQQTLDARLNVRIAIVRDLVIARKPIRKGEIMTAENIERVRRPIDNRRVRFASFEQIVGKQSRANVSQYDLIKSVAAQEFVAKKQAVIKKNALVNVIVRRGALEVVLKGARAIDAGNPGDQIALLNPHTREQIVARIIDGSTAEVRY